MLHITAGFVKYHGHVKIHGSLAVCFMKFCVNVHKNMYPCFMHPFILSYGSINITMYSTVSLRPFTLQAILWICGHIPQFGTNRSENRGKYERTYYILLIVISNNNNNNNIATGNDDYLFQLLQFCDLLITRIEQVISGGLKTEKIKWCI